MSLNAATIEILLAKGLSGEDLLEVARATEVRADPTNAQRQARHREKKKAERNGVTVTRRDAIKPPLDEIENLIPPCEEPIEPSGSKPFAPPNGVTPAQWADFLTVRRTKRAGKMTTTGYGRLCSKLDKLAEDGWPPGEMIGLAVERGWTSVFAPKDFGHERSNNPTADAVNRILSDSRANG